MRGTIGEPFDMLRVFEGPHGGSGQTSGNACYSHVKFKIKKAKAYNNSSTTYLFF